MTDPAFTILLPVTRRPDLMPFAVESVCAQSRGDFELFIVCDGGPDETVACAGAFAERDGRITVFPFPKGERHGEAHRHVALEQARGRWVCQIADDDLWFPEHLEEIARLLAAFDFGNLLQTYVDADDRIAIIMADLADPAVRDRMTSEMHNIFGPTVCGYRLDAYRRLVQGWSPAPPGLWTDLFMWRKFLLAPDVTVGTRFSVTSLHFPASARPGWTLDRRREELARYARLAGSSEGRDALRQTALRDLARAHFESQRGVAHLQSRVRALEEILATATNAVGEARKDLALAHRRLWESEGKLIRTEETLASLARGQS